MLLSHLHHFKISHLKISPASPQGWATCIPSRFHLHHLKAEPSRFPTSRFHMHHLKAEPPASPQDFPLLGHQLFCADASPQDIPQLVTCITSRLSYLHHLKISHRWATCITLRFAAAGHLHHLKAEPPASPQDFPRRFLDRAQSPQYHPTPDMTTAG